MVAAGIMVPDFFNTAYGATEGTERELRFYNIHTDESIDTCYWCRGEYLPGELETVNHFFRDFRTGDTKEIDVRLLDLLYSVSRKAPNGSTIHLISGYRSPETNQKLRQNSSGVANKSLHMKGYAADIRIPGLKTAALRKIAIKLGRGGVGFYPDSDFVHVDIGPVRQW